MKQYKMIYCTCNVSAISWLTKNLDELKVKNYQVFEQVLAVTESSQPRLNTPVWPGYNSSVLIQSEESEAKKIIERLQELNKNAFNKDETFMFSSWSIDFYNNEE